jgi:hypothetical protein
MEFMVEQRVCNRILNLLELILNHRDCLPRAGRFRRDGLAGQARIGHHIPDAQKRLCRLHPASQQKQRSRNPIPTEYI